MPQTRRQPTPCHAPLLYVAVLCCFCAVFFGIASSSAAAPRLTLEASRTSDQLPRENPAFPTPQDPDQIFFLQRSMNANTVVYAARYQADGTLITETPVDSYWRRYAEQGQFMSLRWYERIFGFGLRVAPLPHAPGDIREISFNALKRYRLELRQTAPFTAGFYARFKNRDYRLIYAYLDVDETGLLPKVTGLRLYTQDAQTGAYVTHTISVSGGAFQE